MKLKKLLDKNTDEAILKMMAKVYPYQEGNLLGYQKTLKQLRKLKPVENDMVIHPYKYNTYGTSESKKAEWGGSWGLSFTRFEEWLGMDITKGGVENLCKCLWEMTYHGFTQQPIQRKINELNKRVAEVQSGASLSKGESPAVTETSKKADKSRQ